MQVTQLWRYPVKSAAGVRIDEAGVGPLGLEGDRRWGLVDVATGFVLTGRRVPDLLLAVPVEGETGGGLALRLPDGTVTDDDALLSAWIGRPVALRQAAPDERGHFEGHVDDLHPERGWIDWEGPAGAWHDSTRTRVSIVAEGSLGDWDVRRFRPNVVVDGADERALLGRTVRIGDVELDVVKEIDRCVMVTRPQEGIERDRSVLVSVHRERAGNFGVGALVTRPGTVRVGDAVDLR